MRPIVIEQHISAPPRIVYRYLTDGDRWKRWQGVDARLDPRVGGLFSMLMANGMNARGQFVKLKPYQLVEFTWGWVDNPGIPPGSTIVEITLEADGDGTLLTLTHRSLPDDELDLHRAGWTHHLARLAVLAGGGDPGPDGGPE